MTIEPPLNQEDVAQLTLEHLKHIRAATDRIENDVRDIKFRMGQVEQTLTHHTGRFDRMENRLLTMERRLGLVDA